MESVETSRGAVVPVSGQVADSGGAQFAAQFAIQFAEAKESLKVGDQKKALDLIAALSSSDLDFTSQHKLVRLFNKLDHSALNLVPIRVAILSTNTVDHFAEALRLHLGAEGFAAEVYTAEFNTIEQSIFDKSSRLYSFGPEVIWLFTSHRDIVFQGFDPAQCNRTSLGRAAQAEIDRLSDLWSAIRSHSNALILQNNADVPAHRTFGHHEANVPWSEASFYREFNLRLAGGDRSAGGVPSGVRVFDLDHLASLFGKSRWLDERYWFHSKHAFAFDAISLVAFHGAKQISAAKGRARKCLVLDLDNTMWGGVIGDDGLGGIQLGQGSAVGEAFLAFQRYVAALKRRGVILAVCSKNEDASAKEPFIKHPEIQLRLEDIAVFLANWNNKAENIRKIAEVLEIGLDSIVFVDDNPVERGIVRKFLPMVAVPEMPEDPAYYVRTLESGAYFETFSFGSEDAARGQMYRENAERKVLREKITDVSEYLRSLDMRAVAESFDALHIPRIAQLINKSNQFHLTTTRYSEAQVSAFAADPNYVGRYYKLKDRFGDNGLISVVIMKWLEAECELFVDTWLMSCRVLSRGMEQFVQNDLLALAKARGAKAIRGMYIPTSKNGLVEGHYRTLGYTLVGDEQGTTHWTLPIDERANPVPVSIAREWDRS